MADNRRTVFTFTAWMAGAIAFAGDDVSSPPGRPAAIHVDGVPEIPDETFRNLHRYQEIRSASFQDWDPAGGVLVSSRIGSVHQIYRVQSPGQPPQALTGGPEPVMTGRSLPGGGFLFSRGKGGDENFQIFRADGAAREPVLLTDGTSRNLLGPADHAGRRVACTSTARNGRDADVFALDPSVPGKRELLLQVENETWSIEDWSPDGERALFLRTVSANESHAHLLDLATKRLAPLPAEMEALREAKAVRVRRDGLRFGPGGKCVYLTSDARGELRELARLDLASGACAWLTRDLPHDVDELELDAGGRRAAFAVNRDGQASLFVLDLEAIERSGDQDREAAAVRARREVTLPPGVLSGLRFSRDGRRLGFTAGFRSSPPEAHSYDLERRELVRWTFSERSGFRDEDFIQPEAFRYPSFDGRDIPALILRPPGREKPPVVIAIHGGPEGQSRPGFSAMNLYYARELGCAVILPNVRGSTGYGKTYAALDNGILREDSVKDIGALLDWIAKQPGLDASRVAVIGGSYGGYMVLASLVHFGDRLRAGVDIVGISNFATFLENTSPYRRELRRAEYGDEREAKMREFFARASPAERIAGLRSALLVIHGANDPRVPISEARQVVARARASGQPVWTLYADNEGHGFTRRENTDHEQAVIVTFLKAHLLGPGPTGDTERALAELDRALTQRPSDGRLYHTRAVELFKLGRFRESTADFERAVELGGPTHGSDECWERGLARYYAGDLDGGKRQFEAYHRVGPLDIENGLWVLLCSVKKEGLEKARAAMPAYRERQRRPFPALLDLYLGKGSPDAVLEEATKGLAPGPELEESLFYAHFYAGKYLQAVGDGKAADHLKEAQAHRIDHFMYWCAKAEGGR